MCLRSNPKPCRNDEESKRNPQAMVEVARDSRQRLEG
jgi:hypothetical protein